MPDGQSFDGAIITERIGRGGLVPPPGFARRIPERVIDSGRIFRAIDGLEDIYQTKGSGASPEMLRSEMGVLYSHDLQSTLATQESEVDAVIVSTTAAAANTTATTTFSFQTMPDGRKAEHHRILSAVAVMAAVANVEGGKMSARPFGDPSTVTLGWFLGANADTIAGHAILAELRGSVSNRTGIWGKRETDYEWLVRSNAGGAATVALHMLVEMVPAGVQVPV